jgi:hypothetical protein
MNPVGVDKEGGKTTARLSNGLKLLFGVGLAIAAGVIGYTQITRSHPAQTTVKEVFELVEEGDVAGVMNHVDPEGQLGVIWDENIDGAREQILAFMERYRLDFDALKFGSRAEGDLAEVELEGGRITVYSRGEDGPPMAVLDVGQSELLFQLEKKEDAWLIEAINYDLSRLFSEEQLFSPF